MKTQHYFVQHRIYFKGGLIFSDFTDFDILREIHPHENPKNLRIDRKMNTFQTNFILLAKINSLDFF